MPQGHTGEMKAAVLVYPHQLFAEHPAIIPGRTVYVIEDPLYFSQYKFHTQKIVLHRASMQAYAARLREEGNEVRYLEHADVLASSLPIILGNEGIGEIHVADVVDDWLGKKIGKEAAALGVPLVWHETPQFLLSDEEARTNWGSKKKHLHHTFYAWQRTRLDVLMDEGKPAGGKWSYDAENRKRIPKDVAIPGPYAQPSNAHVEEAIAYADTHFSDHYGTAETFAYAVTHEDARACLKAFLRERLASFGAYEDAITERGHALFHSVLSPYLNNGLLTPKEVLEATLAYARTNQVPIASLEGFVRQLIGWREFIRMMYVGNGAGMRNQNALKATRSLTEAWWDGTTGMPPIDESIRLLKEHAYTHHIVRLMIIGNSMTLLGVKPDEAYRWFMEWYIDAYDWVMVPNVYGMALFADGGSMVTKPYVSSSRYLLAMSDYPKGPWCAQWDALYWAFVHAHAAMLARNVRSSLAVSLFKRFAKEKQEGYLKEAKTVYSALTS